MTDERNDQSAPGTSGSGGSGGANEAVVLAKRGNFPEGLRVVVVDDDPLCLRVVERMLIRCSYIVSTYSSATDALKVLREGKEPVDIVLSDVHMPDMDGFKLLEAVGLDLNIPVIMMSSNSDTEVVLRGVTHGAVDYLLKPINIKELRNIWQHVVRQKAADDSANAQGAGTDASGKKRAGDASDGRGAQQKKQRVVWSVELHQKFVNAVNLLGIEKAVPKRILDLMEVPTLTRENVASHLQKYRLYLKKMKAKISEATGADDVGMHDRGLIQNVGPVHVAHPNQHDRLGGAMLLPAHGGQVGMGGVPQFSAAVAPTGIQNPGMYSGVGIQAVDMHPMSYHVPMRFPQGLAGDGAAPGPLGLDDVWLQNPGRNVGRPQPDMGPDGAGSGESQQPKDSDMLRGYFMEAD